MDPLFFYGFPLGALFIGAIAVFLGLRESRAFDRRYGSESSAQEKATLPPGHRPA